MYPPCGVLIRSLTIETSTVKNCAKNKQNKHYVHLTFQGSVSSPIKKT